MLLTIIAPLFVIILAGFLLRRSGLLSAQADASLMRMYVNLLYPCLIAVTIIGNDALNQGANLWLPPLIGFLTIPFGFLVCWIGARLLRVPRGAATRTFTFVTGIYNFGYTAIPVVGSLFGARALGVLFIYNLGVELAFWIGASLILAPQGDRRGWRQAINTPVVTLLCAVALHFLHVKEHMPAWIFAALQMLGGSAIPLALLLTGAIMMDFLGEARPSRSDGVRLAGSCGLRLGLLPLSFLALAHWGPGTLELKQVLVVQSAMPAAMLPVVLCKHYGSSQVGLAVQIVLGTTILALLTMPYWINLGLKIAGL